MDFDNALPIVLGAIGIVVFLIVLRASNIFRYIPNNQVGIVEADRALAVGTANAQATKLAVDAYGGPEFRLAEQNFARFADALTKINQPLVPQFLMSRTQGHESGNAGLIPTAMLSSMFGQMMPEALERLKDEAPKAGRRPNGA